MSPRQGKRVKVPLLPNSVGKKSANDVGPKQGHDTAKLVVRHFLIFTSTKSDSLTFAFRKPMVLQPILKTKDTWVTLETSMLLRERPLWTLQTMWPLSLVHQKRV